MKHLIHTLTLGGLLLLTTAAHGAGAPLDFTLQSAIHDTPFRLADQRGRFVVVHFLLKTECPVCIRHTRDYQAAAAQWTNAVQIFVKPDTAAEIQAWAKRLPKESLATLPLYRDPEATLAKQLGIPGGYQFHGQVVHYPALVLIGPDGREVFRHVGKSNTDRYPVAQLQLRLGGKPGP